MSLQVWLPLNQDLRNNGIAPVTVVNNGATLDNNGKIGKCYSFNGSSNKLTSNFTNAITSSIGSLACWVKVNSFPASNAWYNILQLGNIGGYATCRLGLYFEYTNRIGISIDGSSSGNIYTHSLQINQWYHLCVTYDGTILKLYINGEEVLSKTASKGSYTTDASSLYIGGTNNFYLNGYLNDVRYYNHCLSTKEVKELAKGLVLHYKLDGLLSGINENLLQKTPKLYNSSAYNAYQLNLTENLITNQTYTLQLWDVNVSHNKKDENSLGLSVYWGGGTVKLITFNGTSYFTNGHADYLKATFTITSSQASGSGATNSWLNIYNSVPYVANTMSMSIKKWKLEKGSIATNYCKTIEEMGIDNLSIIDSSGNGYEGTIEGTISIDTNTPKNSASTNFSIDSGIFSHLNITLSQFTISFWAKHSVANKMLIGSNVSLSSTNNKWYWYGDNSFKYASGEFYYKHNAGSAESLLGTWIHFVAVYDGEKITIYRNGINEGNKTVTGNMVLEYLSIGNGYASRYRENGNVSDFRLYSTALSEADIKQLYQIPISINNKANIISNEFKENILNRELLAQNYTSTYSSWSNGTVYTKRNEKGELFFEGASTSCGSEYIPINPTNKTYYYDYTISVAAGNQFYIGFERYDANKTARSNYACVYTYATKPSSDVIKTRYKGTVNLSTDGVNPCAFIRLRVLNAWGGTDSSSAKTATIHQISLREVETLQNTQFLKTGQIKTDILREFESGNASLQENEVLNSFEFIEY